MSCVRLSNSFNVKAKSSHKLPAPRSDSAYFLSMGNGHSVVLSFPLFKGLSQYLSLFFAGPGVGTHGIKLGKHANKSAVAPFLRAKYNFNRSRQSQVLVWLASFQRLQPTTTELRQRYQQTQIPFCHGPSFQVTMYNYEINETN